MRREELAVEWGGLTYSYVHDALHEVVVVHQDSVRINIPGVQIVRYRLRAIKERVMEDLHEHRRVSLEGPKTKIQNQG